MADINIVYEKFPPFDGEFEVTHKVGGRINGMTVIENACTFKIDDPDKLYLRLRIMGITDTGNLYGAITDIIIGRNKIGLSGKTKTGWYNVKVVNK